MTSELWLHFIWTLWYGQFVFLNLLVEWLLGVNGGVHPLVHRTAWRINEGAPEFISVKTWWFMVTGFSLDCFIFVIFRKLKNALKPSQQNIDVLDSITI